MPRVLAVLVAHNGMRWLHEAIAALETQTYPHIDLVAVDNASTDGSREFLIERVGDERALVSDQDLGFAGAVSMALDSAVAAAADAEYILFVHDDLVLEADAVERLVRHLEADQRLAVAGPKLVAYEDARLLRNIGMSIDLTGRADSGLEPDELDQGQHDDIRRVLYVSTAGMLVRRDVYTRLGGFDRRYGMFREDLDLCWRVWLAGHDVEVVPFAVGRHAQAAATYDRQGITTRQGERYLAERNTLATLMKCYGALRLVYLVPLFFVVGAAKIGGFLVTRRVTDAWETVRAWGWNLRYLRVTRRLRRPIQEERERTDGEIRPLFARTLSRLRAYVEAIVGRVVGEAPQPVEDAGEEAVAGGILRRRPGLFLVGALLVLGLLAALPLLGPGALRGGDLAPWPASPVDFFRAYTAAHPDGGGLGVAQPISPAQPVLGLVALLTAGSEWLASRLLIIGVIPVAWLAALPALRLVTERRGARLAGASLYALSPPAIAAVGTARLGAMAMLVLLPAAAVAARHVASVSGPRDRAWRASAAAALVLALLIAFEPPLILLLGVVVAAGLVAVTFARAPVRERLDAGLRMVTVTIGTVVLLLPWSASLLRADSPVFGGFGAADAAPAEFHRWLLLVPDLAGFPHPIVGVGFVAAAAFGIFLGAGRRPGAGGALLVTAAVAVSGALLLGWLGPAALAWPGHMLLVAAGAYAALFSLGLAVAREHLSAHTFGWRQVTAMLVAAVIGLGGLGMAGHVVTGPFEALVVAEPALPAFIGAASEPENRYRVLVLDDSGDDVVWDVVGSEGPTMLLYGADPPDDLLELTETAVTDLVSGLTPTAGARLGHANVRYIYVPEGARSERLEVALASQIGLEPQAVEHGLVYRIRDWLPRAVFVPPRARHALVDLAPLTADTEVVVLDRVSTDRWQARVDGPGIAALAEPASGAWAATVDGSELEPVNDGALVRFVVPHGGRLALANTGGPRRTAEVLLQAGAALVAVSLALRAPGFARRSSLEGRIGR
jgi:GT2 family glycosyltransferase